MTGQAGEPTKNEAYELYREAKTCFATGNFNLRKWASNDKTLINRITQERVSRNNTRKESATTTTDDESFAKIIMGHLDEIDSIKEHKVLGLNWDLEEDKICLKVGPIAEFASQLEPTKRNVLKIAAKLFDPLGLISPALINFRLMLQELCVAKYDWDSPISAGGQRQLKKWLKSLETVNNIVVDRYYFSKLPNETHVKQVTLHGFGDASKKGYCAVVYLCVKTTNGYETSLVASKSRVAPIAPMTIPRLELVAALILSRLMSTVKEALAPVLEIKQCRYWTDSRTVLYWIQSNREYKQFVQNRVSEINRLTNATEWEHCPGVENPADLGSRGCLASELVESKAWWEGPPWLKKSPECHPKTEEPGTGLPDECEKEIRLKQKEEYGVHGTCLINTQEGSDEGIDRDMSKIFDVKKLQWTVQVVSSYCHSAKIH